MTDATYSPSSAADPYPTPRGRVAAVFLWLSAIAPAALGVFAVVAGIVQLTSESMAAAFAPVVLFLGVLALVLAAVTLYVGLLARRGSRTALVWSIILAVVQLLGASLVFGAFWSQAFDAADAGARALGALSGSAVTLTAALSVTAAILVARAVKRHPR